MKHRVTALILFCSALVVLIAAIAFASAATPSSLEQNGPLVSSATAERASVKSEGTAAAQPIGLVELKDAISIAVSMVQFSGFVVAALGLALTAVGMALTYLYRYRVKRFFQEIDGQLKDATKIAEEYKAQVARLEERFDGFLRNLLNQSQLTAQIAHHLEVLRDKKATADDQFAAVTYIGSKGARTHVAPLAELLGSTSLDNEVRTATVEAIKKLMSETSVSEPLVADIR